MDHNNRMPSYSDVYFALETEIPQILKFIKMFKESDYRKMANALQTAEANLMVSCFQEFMDENPSSLLHDAIYFTSDEVEKKAKKICQILRAMEVRGTLKVSKKVDKQFSQTQIYLTFDPNSDQLKIMRSNPELFSGYPIEFLHKSWSRHESKSNDDFMDRFEKSQGYGS